jgi:Asp-tRNA(Asn)/Glu-tRNA(Gln) amidotransferase A subunit family amidase
MALSGFVEYAKYDALGLADLVRRREVTAEELLEAAIARSVYTDATQYGILTACNQPR